MYVRTYTLANYVFVFLVMVHKMGRNMQRF